MSFSPDILRASLSDLQNDPGALIEIILQQAEKLYEQDQKLQKQDQKLQRQQKRIRALIDDLEEAQRQMHRTAAPHRIASSKRKRAAKPPGRKKGHRGAYRRIPRHIDQTLELALPACPHCRGALTDVRDVVQVIEDLPPVRAHVTKLVTQVGHCPRCGPVRSTHPLQCSHAEGAASVHLGPNALALAAELIYDFGLTRRKVSRLLKQRFGLSLTPGGLVHAAHRLARRLGPRYEQLKASLGTAAVVHSDETSWYVGLPGGEPRAWLWVFCHSEATIYRVERSRARAIITQTLGWDFPGVLVSDCLNIYDGATPVQQKCYSHHLKAISQAIERSRLRGDSTQWLRRVRCLLKTAMILKAGRSDLSEADYQRYCRNLEKEADVMLSQARAAPADQSVARRLLKQRDHLFEFLYHEQVDATNNLAERQLRPAVIARKVSCGNRSEAGARTWEVLASLAATARQRGESLSEWIVRELSPTTPALLQR